MSILNLARLQVLVGDRCTKAILRLMEITPGVDNGDAYADAFTMLEDRIEFIGSLEPTPAVIRALEDLHTVALIMQQHFEATLAKAALNSPAKAEAGSREM